MSFDIGPQLVETEVNLVINYLKANIANALTLQNNLHGTTLPVVSTEAPRDYFIYPKAQGYRTPAVFVIPERMDFKKKERGANHVNAETRLNITVLIEDKDAERLYYKSYRYQAAMFGLLDQAILTSGDSKVKIVVVVESAQFSPLYSNTGTHGTSNSVFRKEVWLECAVQHYESLK